MVFASRHGDLQATVSLLSDLAKRELLSPATFSLSVHNAHAGILAQCVGAHGSHTAIAGGAQSLHAGLLEAYARIASGEAEQVLLVFADVAAPDFYEDQDESGPDVTLALRVRRASDGEAASVGIGRTGAAHLVAALKDGTRRVRFAAPTIRAEAA